MGEDRKKSRVFFPFFLFVGIGLGFLLIEFFGALAVVALTFVGLGLGFLFDSIVIVEERRVTVGFPVKISGVVYCVVGVIFIISGILSMIAPELLINYVIYFMGLGFVVVGAYLLVYGLRLVEATSKQQ